MRVLLLLLGLIASVPSFGQTSSPDLFEPLVNRPDAATSRSSRESWYRLDEPRLRWALSRLDTRGETQPVVLWLPDPDGSMRPFAVSRSVVMAPELAARFPEIETFQGQAVDGSRATLRFELSPVGFTAMTFVPGRVQLIEPDAGTGDYVSFVRERREGDAPFRCSVTGEPLSDKSMPVSTELQRYAQGLIHARPKASGPTLRTYRTAVAATVEYTASFGGTVLGAMQGIATAINRINQVYETEIGVRLVLVPNNAAVVYTVEPDPYTNNNGSTMLGENQTNLTNVIGSANYDVGHVFSTAGGGVATLGSVCDATSKARGVTGQPSPNLDPFWVDYVAHEIGHQLNAPHTFNGSTANCIQRSAADAYEVGSGSTIMAYAGICGGENLQPNSDPFFHVRSLDTIHTFVQSGGGATCGSTSATGNQIPVLTPVANRTIPARTPFALTASATDPDGDPLSYSWEQFDLGAVSNATTVNQDDGTRPLFRSFDASSSPTRLFPRLANILSGTQTIGEVLPTTNRSLNFRVTVRDNRPGGGGVQWTGTTAPSVAQTTLTVVDTGAAFAVTGLDSATTWAAGSAQTVTWDVAGTTAAPISCANVRIDWSTDNGNSGFPTVLLASTPNDGTQGITVPSQSTSAGRVRVGCADNIFFDINNAAITVTGGNAAPTLTLPGAAVTYVSTGGAVILDATATVADSDSANFDGGSLTLTLSNNAEANDRLEIRNQGNGAGEIGVSGSSVQFGGTSIGSFSGGVGTVPLVVQFNASATPAAAQALLRNLSYRSATQVLGTLPRTVTAQITDGDGGVSVPASKFVNISFTDRTIAFNFDDSDANDQIAVSDAITYTIRFTRDIDLASVSAADFDNAGTATFAIDSITEPSAGTLSVQLRALTTGTLILRIPASATINDVGGPGQIVVPAQDENTLVVVTPLVLVSRTVTTNGGLIQPNSCNSFDVQVRNEAATTATGISGIASSSTAAAPIAQASSAFANAASGATVGNSTPFQFSVAPDAVCGSTINAEIQLNYGGPTGPSVLPVSFQIGALGTVLSENFDGVTAPALPSGWTTSQTGVTPPPAFATTTTGANSAPNVAFTNGVGTVASNGLVTPAVLFPAGSYNGRLSFQTAWNFESGRWDGGVVEVSTDNGTTWLDVTNPTIGGSFVQGGYNGTIQTGFNNPLSGRSGFVNTQATYQTMTVQFPSSLNGQTLRFRFRAGWDSQAVAANPNWRIDGVVIQAGIACTAGSGICAANQPSRLAFASQPSNAATNAAISPAVSVRVLDSLGNPTSSTATVNVAIANNPGAATLSGSTSAAAVAGVASFANLSLDRPGVGYTLSANSPGLTGATSAAFNVAGVTVTPTTGLVTTEAGGTASFTVVLTSPPSADVSIGLSSSDTTEGTVSPSSLTFTVANWNVAQEVTVTGVDDPIDDGNVGYTILTAPAISADPAYSGFNAADVSVSNTDNDVASVTVTQSGGITAVTEGGANDSYTLVLTSQPTANVTITMTPDAQLTASPTGLTFTPGNWNVAQTVTVAAVDDGLVEGAHAGTITHGIASADPGYNSLTVSAVTASITDNDLPTLSINDVSLTEGNSGTSTLNFTVTRTGATSLAAGFSFATANDTATAGSDYVAATATGSIPGGGATGTTTVSVTIIGDTVLEPNEVFFVNLSAPTNATISDAQGIGTIINDDVDPCAVYAFPYTMTGNTPAELIQAIDCANANGTSADTIDLNGQTVTLTTSVTTVAGANIGLPQINTPITIQNGTITRNSAEPFRFFLNTSTLTLNNLSLANANSQSDGGAINNAPSATLNISNSRLVGNFGNFGGAIFNSNTATATLTNTLVSGNRSSSQGGGIRNRGTLVLNNSTVAGNFTTAIAEGGGGIANAGSFSLTLNNSIVARNEAANFPAANDIVGAFTGNNSLAGVNPGFVAPLDASDTAPTTGGDYRLASLGAAIDAGNNALLPSGVTLDLDRNPRRVDDTAVADTGVGTAPIVDIGAYERQTSSQPPEVQVSPNSLTLNETGETVGNVVFRLSQAPPTNVTIQLTFDGNVQVNSGSGFGGSPQTVTLTPANAVTGVTVQVRAVDDAIDEPTPHPGNITTAATSSTTAAFNGLAVPDISVAIFDNDTAGVTVSQSAGSTAVTEGGGGDSYTVVLASQPTANVTVNIAFDAAQLIVNGDTDGTTSLVFTPASWNVAQAVSVFAVDDTVLESNPHTTTIVQSVTSTDGNYNGSGAAPVTVTITENDLASITLQGTASTVAETAGQANLTARLALVTNGTPGGTLSSAFSAQVVLTPGTAGQGVDYALATVAVDFPAGSTNGATRAIEVGIINDRLLEPAETFTVGLERTAGNGTVSGTHVVTITDDESGVFTFNQTSGSTPEGAGTYSRFARLTITGSGIGTAFRIQDAASVALLSTPGTATTPADYTLSTIRLDVPANAASPLDLAFEAGIVNDAIDEPNETFTIGFGAVTGPTSLLATGTHVVTIVDDDSAGVVITESSGTANDNNITVTEGGAGSSFAVVLTSQPTSPVEVSMTFNGTIIQVGSPTLGGPPVILSFTSANWNVPQVVNVGAINDGVAANVGSTNLSLVVGSADPNYVGIPTQPASPIVVRIIEDDVPGVTVTEPGGSTAVTEGGATDTYTLVLTSQPSSSVTVTLSPSAQLTTVPTSLVFSPTNWNVAQTVTVSAVDDGIVEGPHSGTVAHAVTSADANFNGLTVAPVAVSITDNDSATVQFAPTSVSQSEATSPMTFAVTLSHPVASGVTVTVNSAPGTAGSPADFSAISNQTVTFAANSTASQTVNVTIANDALDEDDESFTLTLSGLTATGDVTLPAGTATATGTILDDDALPVLSVANVTQPEGNATNTLTFTVNLSPVSGRTVSLTRATVDGSAVSIGPSPDFVAIPAGVVTIPAGQSSVEIPVTINGDTVFEGDEQFTLSLTAVTNATPGSLSATATLTDDDQQPTTTTITSDLPDPSVVGQPYPVAVEVRAQTLSPLGTVSISDGTGASCSAPLVAGTVPVSTMSCTLTSTSAGNKTLTATYAPANTAFGASSGTESHRVDPAATTLALAGPATVRFNTPASYTATLAVSAPGAGTPAGIVTVSSGAQSCTITLPTATPGCTLSFPTLGSRTVTAAFVPANGDFLAASSNPVQTLAFASTDLVVSKDNGLTSYQPNDLLVYTVEVENRGPDGAPGVRILDPVPAGLTNVAWTCVAQGGAICPSAGGAGGLDVVVQTMPSGSRLVYTYYGNVQGSVPEIVNVARVELPANGTLDDPAPGNNSASDIDRLELLFANGFEPSPVNGPSGAVPLPAIELRGLGGRVAWPLLDLGDRSGLAVRVYVRALDDTVEYALATRDGDGRLRLGPWQRFAATPTLRWTAEEDRGGWRVTSARLD